MGRIYSNSLIFFTRLRLFQRENIVFFPRHDYLDYNSTDFSQIIEKKLGYGWGEQPLVCDPLDVKEMSVSNILGALTH